MSTSPLVSVVIPAHNAGRWLAETIGSVLAQSFDDLELIVVDDASSDDTAAVARAAADSRLRLIQNPGNLGVSATRNNGLAAARGEFVAFLDADDLCLPHRLERQVRFLKENPEVGLVGSWLKTFGAREEIWTADPRHDQIKSEFLFRSGMLQSTVMCRRELMERLDLRYDPTITLSEDYELWTRCADLMRLANMPEVLVRYRLHGDNASLKRSEGLRASSRRIRLRQLRKMLADPSPAEEELHNALAEYGPVGPSLKSFDLTMVEQWLLRLRTANRESRYTSKDALDILLYEFWRRCCMGSPGGMRRFLTSPLVRSIGLGRGIRDAVKGMLGRPHYPLPRQ